MKLVGASAGLVLGGLVALTACGGQSTQPPTASATPAAWGYVGETGPSHWGNLDPTYTACATGVKQSPIDVTAAQLPGATTAQAEYTTSPAEAEDTGHAEEMIPERAQVLVVDSDSYTLANVHLHMPSEHTLDGRSFQGEAHYVHRSPSGAVAVVGQFLSTGSDNPAWAPFIDAVGVTEPGAPVPIDEIDWSALLPASTRVVTYPGSLTTPPCTEGVRWIVVLDPVELSPGQLASLTAQYEGNNRPIQPLDGRALEAAALKVE
jgi:carbonic anhydrase